MKESEELILNNKESSNKELTETPFDDFLVLENIIKKRNQSVFNFKSLEKEHESVSLIERGVEEMSLYEKTLNKYLDHLGINVPIKKIGDKIFQIDLQDEDYQHEILPKGYVYQGGAARAILERKLGVNEYSLPRDIDLGYAGRDEDHLFDEELAEKYSADDFKNGHGVAMIDEEYFLSRDFTINEVLVAKDKIILSKDCLLDTVRGILRFTEFEKKESYSKNRPYFIKPKLLAKALRFASEKELLIANSEVYDFQEIDPFHIALHLDRSLERGPDVANEYVSKLKELKQIPPYIYSPEELVEYLDKNCDFVFRFAKKKDILEEKNVLKDNCGIDFDGLSDKYEKLPLKQSFLKV